MANGTVIPKGTGGQFFHASDGVLQADGLLYVAGDAPLFSPITFDPKTGAPVSGLGGAAIGPSHAPAMVVGDPTKGWRWETLIDWPIGGYPLPAGGPSGATPQAPYSPTVQGVTASDYVLLKTAVVNFGQKLGFE